MTINGALMLDTNAASAVMRSVEEAEIVIGGYAEVLVPCVVVGELYYGAYHAPLRTPQLARVQSFVSQNRLVYIEHRTPEIYGRLLASLRSEGRLIPTNDMWIAALAIQHGLPLMTQDRHFDHVDGLAIVGW
jgi:tRNA(fMet)-specific endonuclease VapC